MTDTGVQEHQKTDISPLPESKGELAVPPGMKLRLTYPPSLGEYAGIDKRMWGVLIDAIWPSAKTVEAVCMAVAYCRARNLDPMKRPIHIVPVYSKALQKEVETVWPGIAEIRTTATRTGIYAGKDAAEFGELLSKTFQHIDDRNEAVRKEMEVTFPEWCRITVYKIVQGQRCAFVGPKVYWEEAYATESRFSQIPNEMWADRRHGQLEKCAEAAALRAAFPEELGNEYSAEEMYGRTIEGVPSNAVQESKANDPVATPPRPTRSEFERDASKDKKPRKPREKAKTDEKPAEAPTAQPTSAGQGMPGDAKVTETSGGEPLAKVTASASPGEPELPASNDHSEPLIRGLDILARTKKVADVADLRGTIKEELNVMGEIDVWEKACDKRSKDILADGK